MINADTEYHNATSIEYLHKKGITPNNTRQKNKHEKNKAKISTNPYHKDPFPI